MKYLFSYSDEDVHRLVLRCYGRMKAYVRNVYGLDSQEADDLLQESLCKFLSAQAPVESSKADGYLFRIVRNGCINLRARRPKTVSLDKMETDAAWNLLTAVDFEDSEVEAGSGTDIKKLLEFAEQFQPRTRDIFYMSRVEGLTHEQIARELGISTRAVEKHLRKSVDEYRREFKKPS